MTNSMELTFTQCKQIVANGVDLREAVEQLNSIPAWASLESISEIQGIIQCGCSANAHISCYYHNAKIIFMENTQEIEEVLENAIEDSLTWDVENTTFDQFVSTALQIAVEYTARGFEEMLEGVDWD